MPVPTPTAPALALTTLWRGPQLEVLAARGQAKRGHWTVLAEANRHSQRLAEEVLNRVVTGREVTAAFPPVAATVIVHHADRGTLEIVTGASPGSGIAYAADSTADSAARWVVSNHVPSLLAQLPRRPRLDERALAAYLLLTPRTRPPYEGVAAVPAGARLQLGAAGPGPLVRWFAPEPTKRRGAVADFVAEYCAAIDMVLAAELPESGNVAALMSAGLDSTMVVGTAAGLLQGSGRRVRAYCLDPLPPPGGRGDRGDRGNWRYSDLPDASSMAEYWPHVDVLGLGNSELLTALDTLPAHFAATGLPVLNPDNSVWMDQGARLASVEGLPLLLDGASGNRVFSYQPPNAHLGALLAGHPGAVVDAIRERARARGTSAWFEANVLLGPARAPVRAAITRVRPAPPGARALPLLNPEAVDRLGLRDLLADSPFHRQSGHFSWHPGSMVRGMALPSAVAADVRSADPLAAEPLVRIVASLPDEAFIGVGSDRSFARRAMAGRVPDRIRLRTRRGMQAADAAQWYAASGRVDEVLAELAADEAVAALIDVKALVGPHNYSDSRWTTTTSRAIGVALFIHLHGRDSARR